MDLFNPPIIPNFKFMTHKLDVSKLENPYIQVVWEDTAENFTQERIKSVRTYFSKKYNSTNINVLTKVKTSSDVKQTVDVSFNIMDRNYQIELMKELLKQKGQDNIFDDVIKLDTAVENKMTSQEVTAFKKWYIKKIEFSNFLSYGENQVLDFDQCNGITVVESDPPNFGGKTVLTVDLLLFLFFNTTTKTTKAEEIFNRFSDKNKVSVRGDIMIDGEEYIIVRQIERKKAKSGEWNVKTELDFFKKLADGQLQNFTGEQRRETESFIKNSIGDIDDFLMTILTTASNLEDLLEAKPTARGQVLSRFLGLEFLKKKEETGKELYSEFNKSMMSNVYNTETLKSDIIDLEGKIVSYENENKDLDVKILDADTRLTKGRDYKEGLISQKYNDIDHELLVLNLSTLESEITTLKGKINTTKLQIKEVDVVEPSKYFKEDEYDLIKESYNDNYKQKTLVDVKINELVQLSKTVSGGIKCEHCGIDLMNAALTQAKLSEMDTLKEQSKNLGGILTELNTKENEYVQIKN